jgi:Caspase domain
MLRSLKLLLYLVLIQITAMLHPFNATAQPQRYPVFLEDFNNNSNNWLTGDRVKTNAYIKDSNFYFEGKRKNTGYPRRTEQGYLRDGLDYEIEIRLRQLTGGSEKGYALEWGGNSIDNIFYEFWLRNDGSFSIDRFDPNTGRYEDYVSWTHSPYVKIGDYNVLSVKKFEAKIYFYINYQLVHAMARPQLFGMEIGFIVPPVASIAVDYLNVYTLGKPPVGVLNTGPQSSVYVVVVGLADYADNTISDLVFTANDAMAVYNFYSSPNGGGVKPENITLLISAQASKKHILDALKESFERANENDLVVFYFSGHGTTSPGSLNQHLYLLPFDYKNGNLNTAIDYRQIQDAFLSSKAGKKLWIMDACHSGGSLQKLTGSIQQRMQSLQDKNIAILTSSEVGETSLEVKDLERGLFSYFLSDALIYHSKDADEDKDRMVSILELFNYTKRRTSEVAMKDYDHKQTPQIGGTFNVQLPVSEVTDEK